MEKFPFTNSGFQDLQNQLYQSTDANLKVEEELILLSFKEWMRKHFSLSDEQLLFIAKQDEKMIAFLATQTAIAIVNRLPVRLIKPSTKTVTQMMDSKLIRPESNFSASSNSATQITGELIIEITY